MGQKFDIRIRFMSRKRSYGGSGNAEIGFFAVMAVDIVRESRLLLYEFEGTSSWNEVESTLVTLSVTCDHRSRPSLFRGQEPRSRDSNLPDSRRSDVECPGGFTFPSHMTVQGIALLRKHR